MNIVVIVIVVIFVLLFTTIERDDKLFEGIGYNSMRPHSRKCKVYSECRKDECCNKSVCMGGKICKNLQTK